MRCDEFQNWSDIFTGKAKKGELLNDVIVTFQFFPFGMLNTLREKEIDHLIYVNEGFFVIKTLTDFLKNS